MEKPGISGSGNATPAAALSEPTARSPVALLTHRASATGRMAATTPGNLRNFLGLRFVYAVLSQRARGLSIGVNLNPDKVCNFDCAYCEVNRREQPRDSVVNPAVLATELRKVLTLAQNGGFRELPGYQSVPADLLQLKEVALSGDGEPTLCPNFTDVVQTVVHLRAQRLFPFFKIVLITNATGLQRPQVQLGLKLLTAKDEVWAKLDAGTQEYMDRVNRPLAMLPEPPATLTQVLENILAVARQRPVVIQSLFPQLNGAEPPPAEIEAYVQRLCELKERGAQIALVQVYSAHRPAVHPECGHLPLKTLSRIAHRVREAAGLKAEVF